jgi:lipid II:glycine glycyltransferase (peptidoglycan interpeptide bridge formation enzyme)
MEIVPVSAEEGKIYNRFIVQNYPPVGAFMQTWEWGAFQEALGRKSGRYFLKDGGESVAAFTLVEHAMPFGLSYGYVSRGPVLSRVLGNDTRAEIFQCIGQWARERFPHFLFVRLEPPLESLDEEVRTAGVFLFPPYYVQPRFNLAVPLHVSEKDIAARFHSSTRSNISRAQKRGVRVTMESTFEKPLEKFLDMAQDTIRRNSGKNAFPSPPYFQAFFETIPLLAERSDRDILSVGIFSGHADGRPAATHFVLFFGTTATYLYGASYTKHLNSKVVTYLHWAAMQEAKRRGMRYYDIGGIDEIRWPTLTAFKRQFKGEEFRYIGNLDIPIRPVLYRIYNVLYRFRKA